jgi:acetyltransferase-like isoleucine patch superfamily enzyme
MNKLYRLLRYDWPLHFILLLTNGLPDNVAFLRLRGALARPFLGQCGQDLRLGRDLTFYNPRQIHLGSHVYIARGCWFSTGAPIVIGDEVLFGPYCLVSSQNHAKSGGSYRFGNPVEKEITVGSGSWIAGHVTLTAGCQVGKGCLVGAGSVVSGNLADGCLAGGIPARVIKDSEEG